MLINGMVGFTMMLTVLFCIGDVDSVLNTATGYPFIQVFYNAVNSRAGATVMGAVVLALTWACAIGITTTASRMTWSFARDNGTPFSSALSKVAKHNQVPIIAICVVSGLACLLHLIYIGSEVAFNDVVSLTITGFYSSYFLPAAMLLYRRVKGQIAPYVSHKNAEHTPGYDPELEAGVEGRSHHHHNDGTDAAGTAASEIKKPETADAGNGSPAAEPSHRRHQSLALDAAPLAWGPFHLPGWIGIANNAYACAYMVFVIFWSVWPPATPVTAETMNYSVVVTGGVVLFSMVWYWVRGRHEYRGPVVDEEVEERVKRRGSVVSVSERAEAR